MYLEVPGKIRREREGGPRLAVAPWVALLHVPDRNDVDAAVAALTSSLRTAGLDLAVVHLARYGEGVAYVIGANGRDPHTPQLWLDKETLLPVRLVVRAGASTQETRMLGYGGLAAASYFPSVLEEYVDGRRVQTSEVTDIDESSDVPDTLFAP
jgi:hypothetical protein